MGQMNDPKIFRLTGDYENPNYMIDDVPMLTANPMSDRLPLVFDADPSSRASAASTSDSNEPATPSPGSARPMSGAEASSPPTGPTSNAAPTCATFTGNDWSVEEDLSPPIRAGADRQNTTPLISFAAAPKPNWRLTEEQKQEAVRLYEQGWSCAMLADRFGPSRQSMWDVVRRRTTTRDRIEALPRKEQTAIRAKRAATLKRYRSRATRITRPQIRAVWERDQTCQLCGMEGDEIDHITPVSRGGQTVMENLQLVCEDCHKQKTRRELQGEVAPPEASSRSISSAEASRDRAKTSLSPDGEPDSAEPGADSSSSSCESQMSLLGPEDGALSRMCRVYSVQMEDGTWLPSSGRWPTSGSGIWPTECWTHATSESPNAGAVSTSLRDVLEASVPARYFLSPKAAAGILRRAAKRGRELPSHLSAALEAVAQTTTMTDKQDAS